MKREFKRKNWLIKIEVMSLSWRIRKASKVRKIREDPRQKGYSQRISVFSKKIS